MIIRRIKREDKVQLKSLFETVVTDTYTKEGIGHMTKEIKEEVESKMKYIETDFETEGKEQHFLVAEVEGKIVGCGAYGPCSHLIYDHLPELKSVLELGSVFVHPDFHNQKIGSRLVDQVLVDLKEVADEFCLDSGYTIAKKIWTKRFGKPQLILKDFWGEGFDHYIWHVKF